MMRQERELSKLLAAERAERPLASVSESTWRSLQSALAANTPALPVAHGPLHLGISLAAKSFLGPAVVAFAVTTSGLSVHAVLQAPPAIESAPLPRVSTPRKPSAPVRTREPAPSDARPEPAPTTVPSLPRASSPSVPASSTFTEELRLIKSAKRELDAGHPHLARVWLDEHERAFPQGIFRAERQSLRAVLASPPRASENPSNVPASK
jgi:hypothetical protein